MNNSFRKKDMICGMSPSFTADFFEGSMKPKVKVGSIPAAGVSEQHNQHNGGVFSTTLTELNVHGGWLVGREGRRENGREGGRERRKEGGRKGGKEGERKGRREGGKVGCCLASSWDLYQCTTLQEVLGRSMAMEWQIGH